MAKLSPLGLERSIRCQPRGDYSVRLGATDGYGVDDVTKLLTVEPWMHRPSCPASSSPTSPPLRVVTPLEPGVG
jgi:hypothetical protein